ncbi:MAG TPA: energy transducer TonB [Chthoniobacterales bacterium]
MAEAGPSPRPLLFRPPPRWHVWAALGGALLIHIGAVVAAMKHEQPPANLEDIPSAVVEATMEAAPEPTPPPEEIVTATPPPEPEATPEYVEERTPPPKQPKATKVAPVKAPVAAGRPGTMSISTAKALATYAPRPAYPYEARARHVTGSGVCVVDVDPGSGSVTGASMAQSIGSPILDNAALSAFRQWRFRPGTVSKVKIPITFTMTGASY